MPLQASEVGVELAHVTVQPGGVLSFTTTTNTNIAGLTTTATVGTRPVRARVELEIQNALATTVFGIVKLWEDNIEVASWRTPSATVQFQYITFAKTVRLTPTVGEHTYRVTLALNNGTARELQIPASSLNVLALDAA